MKKKYIKPKCLEIVYTSKEVLTLSNNLNNIYLETDEVIEYDDLFK